MSILFPYIKYWLFCFQRFARNLKIIVSILALSMLG
jgi:hypothetical protein